MYSRIVIVVLIPYLLGSIPFGYILVRIFPKQDIRHTGSGNIGATNVARSGKKGLAIVTLLLDAGKGALAIYVVYLALRGGHVILPFEFPVAAFFAVLGHCFPVWLGFKGGKGVATAVGAFAAFSPKAVLVALVCFILIFTLTRYVSLSSIAASIAFPAAGYFFVDPEFPLQVVPIMSAASLLIIWKHHANIRRLMAGTEPKFGRKAIGWNDPAITEKNI